MRLLILTIFVFGAQSKQEKANEYFPLKEGYEWTYKETVSKNDKEKAEEQTVTFKVLGTKKINERNCYVLLITYDNKNAIELCYTTTDKGTELCQKVIVQKGRLTKVHVPSSALFLKTPLKEGDKWEYGKEDGPSSIYGGGEQYKVTNHGTEKIKVEAGEFKCFRINYKNMSMAPMPICNIIGRADEITIWFSEDIGIVKQEWKYAWSTPIPMPKGPNGGTVTTTRELVKFDKWDPQELIDALEKEDIAKPFHEKLVKLGGIAYKATEKALKTIDEKKKNATDDQRSKLNKLEERINKVRNDINTETEKQVTKYLKDLEDSELGKRNLAATSIINLGKLAKNFVEKALKDCKDKVLKWRLEKIIEAIDSSNIGLWPSYDRSKWVVDGKHPKNGCPIYAFSDLVKGKCPRCNGVHNEKMHICQSCANELGICATCGKEY